MGDTIKDQLDELEKSADNFANEIVNTFKEMEESDKEFQKSFDSILTSVSCYNIGIAIQKEIKYLLKYEKLLGFSNGITKRDTGKPDITE